MSDHMFDIEKAFTESGIGKDQFEKISKECREDFPNDEMMYELHVIRALRAWEKRNQSS
jgi:hypothetical protein